MQKNTSGRRYCFALDLVNDAALIEQYKAHHAEVWPEIIAGIREVNISGMEIYLTGNRMFMIMDTTEAFDFERDMKKLGSLPRQAEWEALMWKFQQSLPGAAPGEKWMLMEKVFDLNNF